MATAKTTVTERELMLGLALRQAIEQLQGWVAWKCSKKHKPEHEAFIERLQAVCGNDDPQLEAIASLIKMRRDAAHVFTHEAVVRCLDVLLRMVPGYCMAMGVEQCADAEHDEAIHRAAIAVYGPDAALWPKPLVGVVSGQLE